MPVEKSTFAERSLGRINKAFVSGFGLGVIAGWMLYTSAVLTAYLIWVK